MDSSVLVERIDVCTMACEGAIVEQTQDGVSIFSAVDLGSDSDGADALDENLCQKIRSLTVAPFPNVSSMLCLRAVQVMAKTMKTCDSEDELKKLLGESAAQLFMLYSLASAVKLAYDELVAAQKERARRLKKEEKEREKAKAAAERAANRVAEKQAKQSHAAAAAAAAAPGGDVMSAAFKIWKGSAGVKEPRTFNIWTRGHGWLGYVLLCRIVLHQDSQQGVHGDLGSAWQCQLRKKVDAAQAAVVNIRGSEAHWPYPVAMEEKHGRSC